MTSYNETILWFDRIGHLKNLVRGDMIYILELSDAGRIAYFRAIASLDEKNFLNAWVNASEELPIQNAARQKLADEVVHILEEYYQELYTARFNAKKLSVDTPSANNVFQPYGFQPYGYATMDSMLPPIDKILNKDTDPDWLDHSVYNIKG